MDLNEPIIVLITGPMTNIAMLLRTFPEVKQKIKFILLMGGSIGHGNVSPAA
jgi:non-specific riboncleoside hydrolase